MTQPIDFSPPAAQFRTAAPRRITATTRDGGFVEFASLSAADVERWRALGQAASTPNPYYEPGFMLPAVKHLRSPGVTLLVARVGGEWVAAMPVVRSWHWRGFPGPVVSNWSNPYCYLGAPLLRRGAEDEALAALLAAALRRCGLLALGWLPADGAYAEAAKAAYATLHVRPVVWNTLARAAIRRSPDGDYVRRTLGAKGYSDIRRRWRRLESAVGGELAVIDRAGDVHAVEEFLRLESSGWKRESGTALATANAGGFFRAVCAEFATAGRLRMLTLMAGGHAIAMESSFTAGDTVFNFKLAYDEAWSRYAPGIQIIDRGAQVFHDHTDAQWVDSCAPAGSATMNRLLPDRRLLSSTLVPGRSAAGTIAHAEVALAAAVRTLKRMRNVAPETARSGGGPAEA